MPGALVLALGLPTILLLLGSGLWADRRFARFDELPAHYDFKGRPTRFASRQTMVWLIPGVLVRVLGAVLLTFWLTRPELQKNNPIVVAIVICVTVLCAQSTILWLHDRWAHEQG